MQPFIIGIGGAHSNSGKTTLAAALLKHLSSKSQGHKNADVKAPLISGLPDLRTLQDWGAIKYTKTRIYSSIIYDREILMQKDKDTQRLLESGAIEVLWVQSPPSDLHEVLPIAISRLSHLEGIIVEGNSAIEFIKPDVVIFMTGIEARLSKESSYKVLKMADIAVGDKPAVTADEPEKDRPLFISPSRALEIEELINCINSVAGKKTSRPF